MYSYNDFNYVNNLLNSDFSVGIRIYEKASERKDESMLWLAYVNSSFEGSFNDYKNSIGYNNSKKDGKKNIDENLYDIESEEKRIISKSYEIKDFIESEIQKNDKNKIAKETIIN